MSGRNRVQDSSRGAILLGGMTENRGGKESFILQLFESFRDDYECFFLADRPIAFADHITANGGVIVQVPPRGSHPVRYLTELSRLFKTQKFEAVWLNQTVINSIEPLALSRVFKVPVRILHSHSSANMASRLAGVLHRLQKPIVPFLTTRNLACSTPSAEWFFGERPCSIVPNAFEVEKFSFDAESRRKMRDKLSIPSSTIALVQVAHMGPVKNHFFALEVVQDLVQKGNEIRLLLVGDGPMRLEIQTRANDLGITHCVDFLGVRNDVPNILQGADLMLLPSLFEGLPYAALEAQAAGLPVVASLGVSKEVKKSPEVSFLPTGPFAPLWGEEIMRMVNAHQRVPGLNPLIGTEYDATIGKQRYRSILRQDETDQFLF